MATREFEPAPIDLGRSGMVLVCGGPYSNLEATLALQREATRLGIGTERVLCSGDVVAYCADADATAALVRDWGIHVVAGNCEEQIGADAYDCACGFGAGSACDVLAKSWYDFARRDVVTDRKRWMAGLPRRLRFRFAGLDIEMVHGGFDLINRWVFASTVDEIGEELAKSKADIVIAGHSGLPFVHVSGERAWFNPGVIGMPANDGTPDVWYGTIEALASGGVRLATHRLRYDHATAAAKLSRAGFAAPYAEALTSGLWPSLDVLPVRERSMTGEPLKSLSVQLGSRRNRSESVLAAE